ncbi:SUMF1/EgtB/PvdO family nonheme iron enzyme [Chitinophaga ginsengisoli]|uniref:Formylglycine-generating enzyme required for sulfatase activity n=1 Tax=Chitinophaga ginsengisoli TaxID=363837 RepID=A0A2P8G2L9_9BACT|nr:SUMF1/EgtB/PvdO family nonheme iron enzyme [Chitinophaga ginsengisoli]PSL28186.1 formylglycine-generating enzyme required for sulfatase activity [Chitinophaga ginsengisoli]
MTRYDVAISVAVEDNAVARAIVAELEKLRVKCYYYESQEDISWGEHLIRLTMDAYGKHTSYVLLITSRTFVTKYWSDIEKQIALTWGQQGRILQLRLDDTPVGGIPIQVVYKDWQNNPEEIAKLLHQKIRRKKRVVRRKWLRVSPLFSALIITGFIWALTHRPVNYIKRVEVIAPGDTFYISSVEVTVAAYRKYCIDKHVEFPEQPANSHDDGPVRNVTWEEARAYCEANGGRLPTEMEWEYAALAGESTIYSGGTAAVSVAVYGKTRPAKIASRKPNAWGIFDMTGNVAEWCYDWSDTTHTTRVVKGGGYNSVINPINELAVTHRRTENPELRLKDVGFRVVWNKKD